MIRVFIGLTLSILLVSCAQRLSPTGGPKDELAPKLLTKKSTANYLTNFNESEVELVFDEFIDLNNVARQVIISPPFNQNPQIESRGKTLKIIFNEEEELKENATYVINFGDAIRDFTEGNIFKNFRYIFATGDQIDSLSISGKVIDAKTQNAAENCLVMLYDSFQDSIVYQEKPLYFASTEKDGSFKIENIRADSFKLFVLQDENLNYLYDLDTEAIGYLDHLLAINDSTDIALDLEIFVENQKLKREGYDNDDYGLVTIDFNQKPDSVKLEFEPSDMGKIVYESEEKQIKLWYDFAIDSSFHIFLHDGKAYQDTLKIRKQSKKKWMPDAALVLEKNNIERKGAHNPYQDLQLWFNHPLTMIDTDSISLVDTSGVDIAFAGIIDSTSTRSIIISSDWREDSSYVLRLFPNALKDIHELTIDTTEVKFKISKKDIYGTIMLSYSELDSLATYQLKLLKNKKEIDSKTIEYKSSGTFLFERLLPGKYLVEILDDKNGNGIWDSGSYQERKKPEKLYKFEFEELKSNWTLETQINGLKPSPKEEKSEKASPQTTGKRN